LLTGLLFGFVRVEKDRKDKGKQQKKTKTSTRHLKNVQLKLIRLSVEQGRKRGQCA